MDSNTLAQLSKSSTLYAGIGSRETPPKVIRLMRMIGVVLAKRGWTLRSGAADGADAAFESGCDEANGKKEIYLPWKGFNKHVSGLFTPSLQAMQLARELHKNWGACSPGARSLHARNAHQILGKSLAEPVAFTVYYAKVKAGEVQGGTATGVKLSQKHGIDTFNLMDETVFEAWKDFCENEV